MALAFETIFDPAYGSPVPVAPGVARVTVNNPGPFTSAGTNTYVLGETTLAIVDPGPADENHLAVLLRAIAGRPVSHVLVTHTHKDHSPLGAELARRTGALLLAEGPHRPARSLHLGEASPLDLGADTAFVPDHALADGELVSSDGWALRCVTTPGHTANHACFALDGTDILFCGDHVMGWSTTIVAPPDGSMADYMASLDKLLARGDRLLLPGHGGPIAAPQRFLRDLKAHRLEREAAILERLKRGDRTIPALVGAIYRNLDPALRGAAGLSVFAHLEDLVSRGNVATSSGPALDGSYWTP